jgi:hypothetical protein
VPPSQRYRFRRSSSRKPHARDCAARAMLEDRQRADMLRDRVSCRN